MNLISPIQVDVRLERFGMIGISTEYFHRFRGAPANVLVAKFRTAKGKALRRRGF
jgi:hypothetical protein